MSDTPVIEMAHISKSFPGVRALNDVSFACQAGEVHALVGENGAGKSTLIKILSGVYQPDAGDIVLNGQKSAFKHPVESLRAGISVIYQEFSLLPERTVAQNIFLGREPLKRGMLDTAAMRTETRRVLDLFGAGARVSPDALVADLDVATQQMVEIAKAISLDARVVVMDEPTAALNEAECEVLFETIDKLRQRGTAIIYITHRMREVTRLADRVTVLKDGEVAARFDTPPAPEAIVRAMVGRDISDFYAPPATRAGNRRARPLRPQWRQCLAAQYRHGSARRRDRRLCRHPGRRPRGAGHGAVRPIPLHHRHGDPQRRQCAPSPPRATPFAAAWACCPATARPKAWC